MKSGDEIRFFQIEIEYDGVDYAGWQAQATGIRTVQTQVEKALGEILCDSIRCLAAGRTDTGVHAKGQVASFYTRNTSIEEKRLLVGVNRYLPPDIRVLSIRSCSRSFDPRGDARVRWYRYSILNRPVASALDRNRLYHVPRFLDWSRIETALSLLQGKHDFSAFRSSRCGATRTLLTMREASHTNEHPVHHIDFKCRSFLHHMIRILVGLLVEVGTGKQSPEIFREMLQTGKRTVHFRNAPPHGLTLMHVEYATDMDGDS
ncbi:tRNA pseudouridine(38-40) synthase TruA [Candidatus Sumerlaeota bacterium]|nr:tRNA pseudouridine(38-40) synthase TruA [Candidatus Sumerlaeota bacterium]